MRHILAWVYVVAITIASSADGARTVCTPLEVQVPGGPTRERVCKPLVTQRRVSHKLRHCHCKENYVRDAWGKCIHASLCLECTTSSFQDYHPCAASCLLTCESPSPQNCTRECKAGCTCPPGYVQNPDQSVKKKCIPVTSCPPKN